MRALPAWGLALLARLLWEMVGRVVGRMGPLSLPPLRGQNSRRAGTLPVMLTVVCGRPIAGTCGMQEAPPTPANRPPSAQHLSPRAGRPGLQPLAAWSPSDRPLSPAGPRAPQRSRLSFRSKQASRRLPEPHFCARARPGAVGVRPRAHAGLRQWRRGLESRSGPGSRSRSPYGPMPLCRSP